MSVAPEEEAEEDSASGAMNKAPGPTEPTAVSTTTEEHVLVGEISLVAIRAAAAAKGHDAELAFGGGMKFGGKVVGWA